MAVQGSHIPQSFRLKFSSDFIFIANIFKIQKTEYLLIQSLQVDSPACS